MMRQKLLFVFTLAALICALAGPAQAERKYGRLSQGNNISFPVITEWGGPMNWASWALQSCGVAAPQFPKGSGNFLTNDGMQFPVYTVRDMDNNGTPEDTVGTGDGGRAYMAYYSSIYAEEQLTALVGGAMNMETASGIRSGTNINQVWTSLDADNLAIWPREARVGNDPNGEPIVKGAETIFSHFGDSFNSWTENNGWYMGMSFYFPDFGEANNMVFGHVTLHQVTHYVKWRPSRPAKYDLRQDGWEWEDMTLMINQRMISIGTRAKWAFHPGPGNRAHVAVRHGLQLQSAGAPDYLLQDAAHAQVPGPADEADQLLEPGRRVGHVRPGLLDQPVIPPRIQGLQRRVPGFIHGQGQSLHRQGRHARFPGYSHARGPALQPVALVDFVERPVQYVLGLAQRHGPA